MPKLSSVKPELLAPAGGPAALTAALENGADAVYLGLHNLNARHGAENFDLDSLAVAVTEAHARSARVYLTLNVTLTERELGQAARALVVARDAGVDAVLICDPALFLLHPHFPELEFHLSTQAGISSSAGMKAAKELGIRRVVLARELSLTEIQAASAVEGIESEVFIQGALCFSSSGHCLLSSWVGGRSGNRGTCTSPCRVSWKTDRSRPGSLLSMHDLSLIEHLPELAEAKVRCLKIEGRLKTAEWVGQVVNAYRTVLDGGATEKVLNQIKCLGNYAGRDLTDGYLGGRREHLTGQDLGRRGDNDHDEDDTVSLEGEETDTGKKGGYTLSIKEGEKGLLCTCTAPSTEESWKLPRTQVKRADRGITIAALLDWLKESPIQGCTLIEGTVDDPARIIPRKHIKTIADRISGILHRAHKGPERVIRIEIPEAVRNELEKDEPSEANRRFLGQHADTVRLSLHAVESFLVNVKVERLVVEGAGDRTVKHLATLKPKGLVIALPAVFYEEDLRGITRLIAECLQWKVPVEVNSWDGWELARCTGVIMEGGPGLAVLNSLAARQLKKMNLRMATLSPEADRRQLEEICAAAGLPLSLHTFGRPPLMITRVALPDALTDVPLEDNREVRGSFRREGSVSVLRPERPFDLVGLRNDGIRVASLVIDLAASPDPVLDWYSLEQHRKKKVRFNYERRLH